MRNGKPRKRWVKKMNERDHKLDKLEHLKFKHRLLDTWISEDSQTAKYETQEMKERKVLKLKMKQEMVSLAKELGVTV